MCIRDRYGKLFEDIKAGRIISAYAVEGNGLAEAVSKMAFGNKLGVKIEHSLDPVSYTHLHFMTHVNGRG